MTDLLFSIFHYWFSNLILLLCPLRHYYCHYLIYTIMTLITFRVYYSSNIAIITKTNNSNNSNNIVLLTSTHESSIRGLILGSTGEKHSYIPEAGSGSYCSENIVKARWGVHLLFGRPPNPPKQAFSTVFGPPQVNDTDAAELHICPKVYIGNALLENRVESAQHRQSRR